MENTVEVNHRVICSNVNSMMGDEHGDMFVEGAAEINDLRAGVVGYGTYACPMASTIDYARPGALATR